MTFNLIHQQSNLSHVMPLLSFRSFSLSLFDQKNYFLFSVYLFMLCSFHFIWIHLNRTDTNSLVSFSFHFPLRIVMVYRSSIDFKPNFLFSFLFILMFLSFYHCHLSFFGISSSVHSLSICVSV